MKQHWRVILKRIILEEITIIFLWNNIDEQFWRESFFKKLQLFFFKQYRRAILKGIIFQNRKHFQWNDIFLVLIS